MSMEQPVVCSSKTHSRPAHADTARPAQAQLGVGRHDTCVRPLTVSTRSAGAGARASMGSLEVHDQAAHRQQAKHGSGHSDKLAHTAAGVPAPASAPAAANVAFGAMGRASTDAPSAAQVAEAQVASWARAGDNTCLHAAQSIECHRPRAVHMDRQLRSPAPGTPQAQKRAASHITERQARESATPSDTHAVMSNADTVLAGTAEGTDVDKPSVRLASSVLALSGNMDASCERRARCAAPGAAAESALNTATAPLPHPSSRPPRAERREAGAATARPGSSPPAAGSVKHALADVTGRAKHNRGASERGTPATTSSADERKPPARPHTQWLVNKQQPALPQPKSPCAKQFAPHHLTRASSGELS